MATRVVHGIELGTVILKALDIDPVQVRRVIVDCRVDAAAIVHIELFGSEEVISIDWPKHLEDAAVKILDKPSERPQVVPRRSRAIHGEWGY